MLNKFFTRRVGKIFAIALSRSASFFAFFVVYSTSSSEVFNEFALYFSIWQIASQVVGLQLGVTLFRRALLTRDKETFNGVSKVITACAIPVYVVSILLLWLIGGDVLLCAILTSFMYSIFHALSEHVRGRGREFLVFFSYSLPPLILVGAACYFYTLDIKFDFYDLFLIEISSYLFVVAIVTRSMWTEICVENNCEWNFFWREWKSISAPLILSNLFLYSYANLPQVISHFLGVSDEEFSSQAVVMRFVAIASSISAIFSLALQRETITLYDSAMPGYENQKKVLLFEIPVLLLCIAAALFALVYALEHYTGGDNLELGYAAAVFVVGVLYFINYAATNFLMAEGLLYKAARAMVSGFFVYILFIMGQMIFYVDSRAYLLALVAALLTTALVRYKSLNVRF